jgi:hypothetical protein
MSAGLFEVRHYDQKGINAVVDLPELQQRQQQ